LTPFIVTLTGPSCAGKSTLEARLKDRGFVNVISTTTRAPRAGEANGKSYYFTDRESFQRMRDEGAFVENVEFNGELYGVSAQEIRRVADLGKPIVVVVEPEGLVQIRHYAFQHGWEIQNVFVGNPPGVIASRFVKRLLADFTMAMATPGKADSVIDSYSRRLGVMLEREVHWAEDVGPLCNIWLHRFDESNIEEVVGLIERRSYDYLRP
jgi:guanylate kinase